MKIAQVTTFFHPVTGGVETHVLNLSRELVKAGHNVEVLCSDSNKIGPRIRERSSSFLGCKVKRFRTLLNLSYYHKFYPGLFFYLLTHRFDIIHVHGFRKIETYYALLAASIRGSKVVLTTHNPFPTNSRPRRLNLLIKIHDWTFGRIFTRRINMVIALVKSEARILQARFSVPAKKIKVIPNGISEEFYSKGEGKNFLKDLLIQKDKWRAIAVSVGRINYAKGLQNLELAVRGNQDVLFIFIGGDDGYLKKLKFIYAKDKNVIFTERFLPVAKIRDALAAADIFLFPSLHEAFGIAMIEAMAQGLPVISTNVGGPGEILNENLAILGEPTDQVFWRDSINKLLQDKKLYQKLTRKSILFARSFRWERIAADINKLYFKLK